MNASGCVLEPCSAAAVDETVSLLEAVWSAAPGAGPVTAPTLHTLVQTGACVLVARDEERAVRGAVIAFRATDQPDVLHLHVVGVAPSKQGGGLGRVLMYAARDWARRRAFRSIEWTFDPLVRRNAYLYLRVLGARAIAYLVDPYGELTDAINAGQGSDRLLASWDVAAGSTSRAIWPDIMPIALTAAAADQPRRAAEGFAIAAVEIPADIESIRDLRPELARAWREQTRTLLGAPAARILGFDDRGRYIVGTPEAASRRSAC